MDLNTYEDLIQKRLLAQKQILNLKKKNIDFENQKVDRDFNNAEFFKPITDSNEKLIDKMEEKNDKINEIISNSLPYYEDQDQFQDNEQLTLPYNEEDEIYVYDISKKLSPEEKQFLEDLSEKKVIPLYTKKNGEEVNTDIKIIGVDNIMKASNDELISELKNKDLKSLGNKISGYLKYNKNNKLLKSYRNAIRQYLEIIRTELANRENFIKNEEITGEGAKTKKRNSYKIVNSKYNDKLLINMPKLLNEMIIEAKLSNNDDILYSNRCDKCTIDLLTKRYNPKKKYSQLAKNIFNDLNDLSGMVKKRNMKSKLIGKGKIILNEEDKNKRVNLIRSSIIAGNDNKQMIQELIQLTNQEINTEGKTSRDLINDLKNLTPLLKTTNASTELKNRIFNIIDYLRTTEFISKTQYHDYIKKQKKKILIIYGARIIILLCLCQAMV